MTHVIQIGSWTLNRGKSCLFSWLPLCEKQDFIDSPEGRARKVIWGDGPFYIMDVHPHRIYIIKLFNSGLEMIRKSSFNGNPSDNRLDSPEPGPERAPSPHQRGLASATICRCRRHGAGLATRQHFAPPQPMRGGAPLPNDILVRPARAGTGRQVPAVRSRARTTSASANSDSFISSLSALHTGWVAQRWEEHSFVPC